MLYDSKRWDKPEVKADPFSLESLIAWLEKQPANGTYHYFDCGRCLLSQYFAAMGFKSVKISPNYIEHSRGIKLLPDGFDKIAVGRHEEMPSNINDATDWKFGKALTRAREALAARRGYSQ